VETLVAEQEIKAKVHATYSFFIESAGGSPALAAMKLGAVPVEELQPGSLITNCNHEITGRREHRRHVVAKLL
jgi:hypothetical protein